MSMPRAVRHINEVRILDLLYRHGTSTRADMARGLGLMRSTVGNLIGGMIDQGLVRDIEDAESTHPGRIGRPGQRVQLNPGHAAFIGADIGVGHISVVAVDLAGRPFRSRSISFEPEHGVAAGSVDALATVLRAVMKQIPPGQTLHGICVAVPGLVDRDGVILRAPVLGWNAVPILDLLRARLKWSGLLIAENDANAFAAAELHGQSTPADTDALYVYLDAGIGGGLVSEGRLLRGHTGYAGEIGHILLGDRGFDPSAPLQGSFESFVGRNAVLARYREQGGQGTRFEDFLAAVTARKPAAWRTLSEWAWWLGRGLASLVSTLDPGKIVLGGPVAALYAHAQGEVMESMGMHIVQPFALPRVEMSTLGTDVCAIGGALLLHRGRLAIDERIVYGSTNDRTATPVTLASS